MGVIYALTFPDGLQYVGQAVDFDRRMRDYSNLHGTGGKVKEWIIKFGWDQVKKEKLLQAPRAELNNDERRKIRELGTLWPSGLNLTKGGDGGGGWGLDSERDARLRSQWAAAVKPECVAKARARVERLSKLPDIEFHAEMARLRRRAEKLGMPSNKLERLYPNTFTLEQIRKLQGKAHGTPGPKATGRLSAEQLRANKKERKRKWDEAQRTSSKSRPLPQQATGVREGAGPSVQAGVAYSGASQHSPRSRTPAGGLRNAEESDEDFSDWWVGARNAGLL